MIHVWCPVHQHDDTCTSLDIGDNVLFAARKVARREGRTIGDGLSATIRDCTVPWRDHHGLHGDYGASAWAVAASLGDTRPATR